MSDGDNYQPRLATLRKWSHFNGYGFNLHAERGKAGQYIGKVDEGSPAEAAGLKQADRIVEVDGTNIGNENHQQVVGRIKAGGDQTTLLVVDNETDKYFKDQRIVVRSDMAQIRKLDSLTGPRPEGADTNEETGENNAEINGITNAEVERDAAPSSQNEIDLDSDAEEVVQPVTNEVVENHRSLEVEHVEATHSEQVEALPDYDEPESNMAEFTPPPPPVDEPEEARAPTPDLVRDPSPEPVRDPSPEPIRAPTPEPERAPTPEPIREPSPEPIRDPSPEPIRAPTPEPIRAPTPEPIRAPTPEPVRAPTPEPVRAPTPEPVRKEQPEVTHAVATNDAQANGDPLKHMSAKQLREQLAAKKKADAKSKKLGFKDKYDIFQKL